MTITLDLTPGAEQELQKVAARQGKTVEALTRGALTAAMLADTRDRPVPQSLDELKPRRQLEPGQTLADVLAAHPWPGDETDEELQAARKAMG